MFLQQTFVFSCEVVGGCGGTGGQGSREQDPEGLAVNHLTWNSTGKLIAGSRDNLVNIWTLAGQNMFGKFHSSQL